MIDDPSRPARRLRLAALLVLVASLVAAAWVYIAAAPSASEVGAYRIVGGQAYADDSSREMQQLERLGGKATVQTFRFDRWMASLWHGQRLAYALAVMGIVVALLCVHVAGLMDEPGAA